MILIALGCLLPIVLIMIVALMTLPKPQENIEIVSDISPPISTSMEASTAYVSIIQSEKQTEDECFKNFKQARDLTNFEYLIKEIGDSTNTEDRP